MMLYAEVLISQDLFPTLANNTLTDSTQSMTACCSNTFINSFSCATDQCLQSFLLGILREKISMWEATVD